MQNPTPKSKENKTKPNNSGKFKDYRQIIFNTLRRSLKKQKAFLLRKLIRQKKNFASKTEKSQDNLKHLEPSFSSEEEDSQQSSEIQADDSIEAVQKSLNHTKTAKSKQESAQIPQKNSGKASEQPDQAVSHTDSSQIQKFAKLTLNTGNQENSQQTDKKIKKIDSQIELLKNLKSQVLRDYALHMMQNQFSIDVSKIQEYAESYFSKEDLKVAVERITDKLEEEPILQETLSKLKSQKKFLTSVQEVQKLLQSVNHKIEVTKMKKKKRKLKIKLLEEAKKQRALDAPPNEIENLNTNAKSIDSQQKEENQKQPKQVADKSFKRINKSSQNDQNNRFKQNQSRFDSKSHNNQRFDRNSKVGMRKNIQKEQPKQRTEFKKTGRNSYLKKIQSQHPEQQQPRQEFKKPELKPIHPSVLASIQRKNQQKVDFNAYQGQRKRLV